MRLRRSPRIDLAQKSRTHLRDFQIQQIFRVVQGEAEAVWKAAAEVGGVALSVAAAVAEVVALGLFLRQTRDAHTPVIRTGQMVSSTRRNLQPQMRVHLGTLRQ